MVSAVSAFLLERRDAENGAEYYGQEVVLFGTAFTPTIRSEGRRDNGGRFDVILQASPFTDRYRVSDRTFRPFLAVRAVVDFLYSSPAYFWSQFTGFRCISFSSEVRYSVLLSLTRLIQSDRFDEAITGKGEGTARLLI
jgi:hypothetical protein